MSRQDIVTPPPIVSELTRIFSTLPDRELLSQLRGPKRRGRPGFDPRIVWRCYLVRYILGLESVAALIRLLEDNPLVAKVCGVESPDDIPSAPTLSRLGAKLSKRRFAVAFREVQRELTRRMYETLPGFGESVAIDATTLRGWSNPTKRGKKRKSDNRRIRPRVGKVSDPDAGWSVKKNTRGNKAYTFGFKAHILSDTRYELPLVIDTSSGNTHDLRKATPLLAQARYAYKFVPDEVLCDAGYSSDKLRKVIKRQYRAEPYIDANPTHKKALEANHAREDWKETYTRRLSIERLNGRLKAFFALDHIRVRGRWKVRTHAHLSVIALQARALAFPEQLRQCVRSATPARKPVYWGPRK